MREKLKRAGSILRRREIRSQSARLDFFDFTQPCAAFLLWAVVLAAAAQSRAGQTPERATLRRKSGLYPSTRWETNRAESIPERRAYRRGSAGRSLEPLNFSYREEVVTENRIKFKTKFYVTMKIFFFV